MTKPARIAVFSPVNPVASGISDYCEEFLRLLQDDFQFTLYLDDYQPSSEFIKNKISFFSANDFEAHHKADPYDHLVWHIGNSPYHNYIYPFLYKYPGIMILHDSWLLGTRLHKAVENWEGDQFRSEMKAAHGEKGESAAEIILCGLHNQTFLRYFHMHELQVRASLLTVVHDQWLANQVVKENPGSFALRVPHRGPLPEVAPDARARVRKKLGISANTFLPGSFGFLGPEKRIQPLLEAFKWMNMRVPDSRCLLVGKAGENLDIEVIIRDLDLEDKVICTGRLPETEYFEHLCACDVVSALRWPTHRESSAAINSAMFYGIPVISSDLVHQGDYPDDVLFRIPVSDEDRVLRETLLGLAMNPSKGQRAGAAGKKYLEVFHSAKAVRAAWLKVFQEAATKKSLPGFPDKSFLPEHLTDS